MKPPRILERTILRKRPCKHCRTEIYLQFIPVIPTIQWISFEADNGKLLLSKQTIRLWNKETNTGCNN